MEKKYKTKQVLPILLIAMSMMLVGCTKDVFNREKVKATYENKFPVKDIDPQMDWKMTESVTVNVAVYEDAGTDYLIRIYDANPLSTNTSARLLAEGTANDQLAFISTMDFPIALTEAYVCRTDPANRSLVKLVPVTGRSLNATFGIVPSARSLTRAENSSITIYSPDRTEAEIASLLTNAKEMQNSIVLRSGDVYKIPKDKTYTGRIYTDGITSGKVATVIVEGTWNTQNNSYRINTGVDLIVTGTGKIILPERETKPSLTFIGSSRLLVFKGGRVGSNSDDEGKIYFSNASNGRLNYNAGTIEISEIQLDGGGIFYNCGKLDVEYLNISNLGGKLINQGTAVIENTTVNSTIENGCNLKVTDHLYGDLILGDNCSAVVEEYGKDGNSRKSLVIGSNSMLTIQEEAYFSYGCTFTGPTNGHALVKIGELTGLNGFEHKGGNIYYEVKETDIEKWEEDTFLHLLKNTSGVLAKWGESPIVIPPGECTGKGNTPNADGGGTPTVPAAYTYVFEDNYPLVGDYDFNDVVLDVAVSYDRKKSNNKITATRIKITLAAAGATKTLGAGLRIVNVPRTEIQEVSYAGTDLNRFQSTLANSMFDTGIEESKNGPTIPLFGDAHAVFNVPAATKVNVGSTTTPTCTYEIVLTQKPNQTNPVITKDNLDFFIAYKYKSMQKRMEVHLYEFRKQGATPSGTIQQENLDLAANNTWAICVPNFRYPKESINICDEADLNNCAYPEFLDWARNRATHLDWYLHPNEKNVYR